MHLSRVWLVLLAGFVISALAQEDERSNKECVTPGGYPGKCARVSDCKYVLDIIRRKHTFLNDTVYVEQLARECGHTPKNTPPLVCCPQLKNDERCGPLSFADRIIGGNETEVGEYPWMALLRFEARNGKIYSSCAGALIGDRFVLTAAHCFSSAKKKGWTLKSVRLAEWNFQNRRGNKDCKKVKGYEEPICRKDYEIARYVLHPAYQVNYMVHLNDIALIVLVTTVEWTPFVVPICLPLATEHLPQPTPASTIDYIAAGWGATSTGSGMFSRLLDVELPSFDRGRCRSLFAVPSGVGISEAHLCAGGMHGKDTCQGDSGGPLMQDHRGVVYLAGITSFGWPKCGREGMPGVYTNVSHFLAWLEHEVYRDVIV